MEAKGKVIIKFKMNNNKPYIHKFIVYNSLKWWIIIGCNFLIRNRMTVTWDNDEKGRPIKVLKDQVRTIAKSPEHS